MERVLPARLHNKFEIEVTDAATGALKQSATCYNIVLNQFFTRLVNRSSKLGYIFLGTGTGTPVITRTSLFSHLCAISATTVETVKAYPTSYVRKKIVLSPNQYVGSRVTEVGFGASTTNTTLVTHSMLKDSEGNQIAILKTDTDVLTVYATFYCTINPAVDGSYVLPSVSNNALIPAIISDTYDLGSMYLGAEQKMETANDLLEGSIVSRSCSVQGDTTNYRWNFTATRLNYNEGGSHYFSSVGLPKIAAWKLPNPDIFPYVPLKDIPVATGDGETTDFMLPVPLFLEDSEVIRVDGVTMERGVDYTINHRQPHKDYPELLPSANPDNVTATGGVGYNSGYYGLMTWRKAGMPNTVGPNNPLIFDFGSVQPFNRITAPENWLYATTWQAYGAIDYSADGEHWTTVYNGYNRSETGRIAIDLTLTSAVQARYWRIRVTNVSWSYDITHYANVWPNLNIWYEEPGLKFTNPPADGAAIEMDCTLDRPIKNENWVLDFSCSVEFSRG